MKARLILRPGIVVPMLVALLLGTSPDARAQVTVTSSSALFTTSVYYGGDLPNDQQANQRSIDLVGSNTLPAFATQVNDGSVVFRIRLNEPNYSQGQLVFDQIAAIGIDLPIAGGTFGLADIALAVSGKNSGGVSANTGFFMPFGTSNAVSPSTTAWGNPYGAFALNAGNFNYSLVSAIDGPAVGDVPGSTGPNAFLTFGVTFAQLETAIRALGTINGVDYSGYTVDYATAVQFQYSVHTGTQANAVNVDVLNAGQIIIPETSTLAFLGAGLLPLLVWRLAPVWRRRRSPAT